MGTGAALGKWQGGTKGEGNLLGYREMAEGPEITGIHFFLEPELIPDSQILIFSSSRCLIHKSTKESSLRAGP